MGRRLLGKKMTYCWWDGKEELLYDKVKATVVGGLYEIEVVRPKEGAISVYKNTVKFLDNPSREIRDKVGQWTLEDRAAYAEQQQRSTEAKAAKEGNAIGSMTLDEVARVIKRNPSRRAAMISVVINHILYNDPRIY